MHDRKDKRGRVDSTQGKENHKVSRLAKPKAMGSKPIGGHLIFSLNELFQTWMPHCCEKKKKKHWQSPGSNQAAAIRLADQEQSIFWGKAGKSSRPTSCYLWAWTTLQPSLITRVLLKLELQNKELKPRKTWKKKQHIRHMRKPEARTSCKKKIE